MRTHAVRVKAELRESDAGVFSVNSAATFWFE
jgi:hypothetical protein